VSRAKRGTLQNYGSLDSPTKPTVVDSRRSIRVVIELDCPDDDYRRIVIPGEGHGEDASAPMDAIEMLELDIINLVRSLSESHDMETLAVKARLGERHEYTTPAPPL